MVKAACFFWAIVRGVRCLFTIRGDVPPPERQALQDVIAKAGSFELVTDPRMGDRHNLGVELLASELGCSYVFVLEVRDCSARALLAPVGNNGTACHLASAGTMQGLIAALGKGLIYGELRNNVRTVCATQARGHADLLVRRRRLCTGNARRAVRRGLSRGGTERR